MRPGGGRVRRRSASRALPYGADDLLSNIRNQGLGHFNGAVLLLVVLNNRNQNAWRRNGGRVQRGRETHVPFGITIANLEPTRLKVVEVRRRTYLTIGILARYPELNVIFFDLPEPEVAATIRNRVVRNVQQFNKFFGIAIQPLVHTNRLVVLRLAENDLLPLEKLVYADEATNVLAVRARLATETGREREKLY